MPDNSEIQIRSEEVQEILSYIPNWMIRWGNTLVLSLIIGLLLISWFVKYPDTIGAEIIITTLNPPQKIYANTSGQLDAILIEDNEIVEKNQILAIIENTANYEDVLLLKNLIDTLTIDYNNFYFPTNQLPLLFLGDVENDYALFERSYEEYILNKELKPYTNEFLANQISINEAKSRLNILLSQQNINKRELDLKKKDLERSESLYKKGVISTQEYDQKQLDYLQAERAFKNISTSISQLRETINNSQRQLRGTEIKKTQDENKAIKNVVQSYNQLKRSLKNWELKYVLKSSINGKVSFLSFWNENQNVNQDDLVFTIIPEGNHIFIGKIKAGAQNSGKIKIGQKVNIRLVNYPYAEFGMLEGKIKNISLVPDNEGNYLIDVKLPNKLITTYNQEIEFKQEMRGTVEIITEDLRLIERFFYQLKSVFSR
ncbi:HlyD family secretion protein [Abyssalbus ytuae]|uniref:HlyD family secretion protein n=1 Tax=Abyssalbus ytuae TaxID=2926907 RepID=A0A9E7D3D4_9FLAO|nr:HlyD family efflux transporter periplasmic adaptor subunit [Abyssalbus ytuae]UOB17724.1 HlyD family secretion protein [Abyssalbus ytuae]